MLNKAFRFLILCFCFTVVHVNAQNLSKSPYSAMGIGDLQFGGNAVQSALGQCTQGFRKASEINNSNPASYGSLKFTVIEAGFNYSSGTIQNNLGSSNISNASYGYLSVGVPLSQKLRWGMSFGLQPMSSMGYNVVSNVDYGSFPAALQNNGKGGLSKFYFGTGIALWKDISIGANISYVWGQFASVKDIIIPVEYNKYNFEERRTTYVGNLHSDYGVQYHTLFKEKYKLVIGSAFSLAAPLSATQDYSARTMGVGGLASTKDTIVFEGNKSGTVDLPMMVKGGFSLEQTDHWMVCADVKYGNWSTYRAFGTNDSLKNMLGLSIGGSFIPASNDFQNYFKRIEYRAGARYDNGYLNVYGTDIATYGFSAGIGLPLGRNKSKLNITGEYFVRGTKDKDLIREEYWRIVIGITFSDKWFVRYKYD